ncbi:biotin--[acetyl-CoA-carboxylase] ligase [Methanolobus sp. ZRKC3]|uniref:biotin--[acetyl-CoA-carboxylase] ligase n=1 Tax=Methanolobus sp. ZRKC3 TaxID=3125786 RepID=UPI003249D322
MADNKIEIIRLLKAAGNNTVSGQEIGEKLGISRAMVWKYIKAIKNEGYDIQSTPKVGYMLRSSPDVLIPDDIKNELNTNLLGKQIIYYNSVESTNNIAKGIADENPEGTVVLAETQEGGRGRMGKEWESLPGGIWFSVILKPHIPLEHASKITLVAGLAVTKVIRDLGVDARIKWPNDVFIHGKKVCGILTEVDAEVDRVDYVVLGIGINANINIHNFKEDISSTSTSLEEEVGKKIDRTTFIRDLLYELEQQYIKFTTQQFNTIVNEWVSFSDTIGKEVIITTPTRTIEGKAVGLTENGALLIQDKHNSREEIIAGSCRYKTD